MILAHRKPTAREGWETLFGIAVTWLVLNAGFVLCYSFDVSDLWFPVIGIAISTVVAVVAFSYALVNIRATGVFCCELDPLKFRCSCPVAGAGDSFCVAVKDIACINSDGDTDSPRWYIHLHSGERFWVTANYDNPVQEFIEELRRLIPSVEVSKEPS